MRTTTNCKQLVRMTLALVALALFPQASLAQDQDEYEARGVVADSVGEGLSGAMVVVLTRPDSTLVKFATSSRDGSFSVRSLPAGDYILQVTLIGHSLFRRDFEIVADSYEAGTINLSTAPVELEELVVSIEHVPFLNQRDTLTYNARAFETRPNATVEDLLQRLPGIEVNEDGSITAQGEDVQNVLVDGKEFFGGEPQIATRNLRADAVERVEVYDKESDMAEFTGIADGEEERTINLELTEEAKSGHFGQITGGVGADGSSSGSPFLEQPVIFDHLTGPTGSRTPYSGSLNFNRFSTNTQLAVIANARNVGGASFGDAIFEILGGGGTGGITIRGGPGGGGGLSESASLGLNLNRDFGSRNWIRSSYFISSLDRRTDGTLQEDRLLGASVTSRMDEERRQESDQLSHRININSQIGFSEGHDLRLRTNFNMRASSDANTTFQEITGPQGVLFGTALTSNVNDSDNLGGNASLTWRKRLNEDGRSLVAEARLGLDDSELIRELSTDFEGDEANIGFRTTTDVFQEQERNGRTLNHNVRLSLTEPVGGSSVLELFGQRSVTEENRDDDVFDLVDDARVRNDRQSSGFERDYTYLRGGFRLNRNKEDSRMVFGAQIQNSDLAGTILDRDEQVQNGYTHLLLSANYRWQINDSRTLNISYNTNSREPSLTQLQPYVNNTNPRNIYRGNPNLEPEYSHNLRGDYRWFDQFSFMNVFAYTRLSYTSNNITNSFTEEGRSPVNLGNAWSARAGVNFGTPIRSLGVEIDVDYSTTYSQSTELINNIDNLGRNLAHGLEFSVENRNQERFELRTGFEAELSNVSYSLNDELNRDYLNSNWFANLALFLGRWTLESDFDYRHYDQALFGPGENVPLLEASVSRLVLDDRIDLRLSAFDLLNRNQSVNFTNSPSYVQESRTQSVGRYFILQASYHLGPGGRGAGGGGAIMIDRRR